MTCFTFDGTLSHLRPLWCIGRSRASGQLPVKQAGHCPVSLTPCVLRNPRREAVPADRSRQLKISCQGMPNALRTFFAVFNSSHFYSLLSFMIPVSFACGVFWRLLSGAHALSYSSVIAGPLEAGGHLNITEITGSVWEPKDLGKHSANGPFVSIAFPPGPILGTSPACEGQSCNSPLSQQIGKVQRPTGRDADPSRLLLGRSPSQPITRLLPEDCLGVGTRRRGSGQCLSNCVSHTLEG